MESQEGRASASKLARLALSIAVGIALTPATASAADETANLGGGLKELVAPPVDVVLGLGNLNRAGRHDCS